jgi:hypothetical protein
MRSTCFLMLIRCPPGPGAIPAWPVMGFVTSVKSNVNATVGFDASCCASFG